MMTKFLTRIKKTFSYLKTQLIKLNKYFSLYEKIWLLTFITIGITISIINHEDNIIYIFVLVAGLVMELMLAKRTKWCFLFVFINSSGLILIGFLNNLYSEMLINLLFWIPYAIIGYITWNKHLDNKEKKNLTEVRQLKIFQTILIIIGVVGGSFLWSFILKLLSGNQPYLDALSTFLQLTTGVLIILRIKDQWFFWILYIFVSATIWILLGQWIMLVISFGYLTNSVYGLIKWSKYLQKKEEE